MTKALNSVVKLVLAVTLLSVLFLVGEPVGALERDCSEKSKEEIDREMVNKRAEFYSPCTEPEAPIECSASANLIGSNNAEKVYIFLTGSGLNPKQAAGIMGNFSVESGFMPHNQQNGSLWPADGWGLAQWTSSRRLDLASKVKAAGLPYVADKDDGGRDLTIDENDRLLLFQLEYMLKESQGRDSLTFPGKKEWEGLKQTQTVREATVYWLENFERAGIPHLDERLKDANDFLTKYGSLSGSTATTSSGVVCEGNGSVGGYSLPVDKKFYTDHKDWFTKPHHDYPSADIPVSTGTKVFSMTSGTVHRAPIEATDTSYGQGVWIKFTEGGKEIDFIYAHGSDGGSIPGAKVGDTVKPGQLIMHSASTGNSDGPHLHLEIRVNGQQVCPQKLFVAIGDGTAIPSLESLPKSGCSY